MTAKNVEGAHERWHVGRGVIKDDCWFCLAEVPLPGTYTGPRTAEPPESQNDRSARWDREALRLRQG